MARRPVWVLGLALLLVAAACGDDDDDTTSDTEGTTVQTEAPVSDTTEGGSTEATATPSDLSLDEAVELVLLAEVPGESPVALPTFNDGFHMAITDINGAGGIGGLPVETQRISAPALDPGAAQTATLRAIDEAPTAIIGLQASGGSLQSAGSIAEAGIPFIHESTANQVLVGFPDSVGSEWGFMIRAPQVMISESLARYAFEELGLENPALVCNNDAFGSTGCSAAKEVAEELGIEFAAEVSVESTATDFTSQILEVQGSGADGVVGFVYPNAVPTFYDQMADNGVEIPFLSGSSSLTWQGITNSDLSRLYGIDDCNPVADPRPEIQEWVERYRALYGMDPTYGSVNSYDAVMLVADAITRAGSTEAGAVRDAIATTSYEGICDTYRGEPSQGLMHHQSVVTFSADGPEIVFDYNVDDYVFG